MKTAKMVRPSELARIMVQREIDERKRKEEAEAAAAAAKGGKKAAPKAAGKKEDGLGDELPPIDETEEATAELIDTIPEPEHEKIEGSERNVALKTTLVCDYAKYECTTT